MRMLIGAVLLMACAPRVHSETFRKTGYKLNGPRTVAINGSVEDARLLALELTMHDIEVSATPTYFLTIKGVCIGSYMRETALEITADTWSPQELQLEVHDANGERVFAVHMIDNHDCPRAFFVEAAASLARNWERVEGVAGP